MAAKAKLSAQVLKECLEYKWTPTQIAEKSGLSLSAVCQRIKALEKRAAVAAKDIVASKQAAASLWSLREATEQNYLRALELLDECVEPGDKRGAIAEVRKHLEFAMSVMETLYAAQETQAFMEEVMQVLDECEPGARERILTRLRERRSIRAAFSPS